MSEIRQSKIFQVLTKPMQERLERSQNLCQSINYQFSNPDLLLEALTHSSAAQELQRREHVQIPWNERLEFLGDSILGLILSTALLKKPDGFAEGELSKIRAALVNEASLAKIAKNIELGQMLLVSAGEEKSGGRLKVSVLADALEALLGAIYLDGGHDEAQRVILHLYRFSLNQPLAAFIQEDYKSRLQELTQSSFKETPAYCVTEQSGPDHNLLFSVEVRFRGKKLGAGIGPNKKKASQEAAKVALGKIKEDPNLLTQGIS